MKPLPFDAALASYQQQAEDLLTAFCSGDTQAVQLFHERHPRFLDEKIPWLPKRLTDSEILKASLDINDAQLAIARWYDFRDWPALTAYVESVSDRTSPVFLFESAVEATLDGNVEALQALLDGHPELVHSRSTRITHFDPHVHGATLLHYLAANGVEGYRQRSPKNAVDIADLLLRSGAEPDALADMYGGKCTTLSMLASSSPPADAGVQVPLIHKLLDYGASVNDFGSGAWVSPVHTALTFGFRDAAEALAQRGARIDSLPAAAGLGRTDDAHRLLATADRESRHSAFALAAQLGHVEVVQMLLDAGEDPNRYNPKGHHTHSTPLHQAALAGHMAVVRLLVERGARLDIQDTIYHGTPLGWALHGGKAEIAEYLRDRKARC